jgi:hypothetical protein
MQRVEDFLLGYQYFRKKGRRKRKSIPLKKEVETEQSNLPPVSVSHPNSDSALMGKSKTVYPQEEGQSKIVENDHASSALSIDEIESGQIEKEQSETEVDFEIDWEAESIVLERVLTPIDIHPTITFDAIQKLNSTLTQTHELSSDQINQTRTTIEILEGTALMNDLKKRTDYESLVKKMLFKENEIVDTSRDSSAIDSLFTIK